LAQYVTQIASNTCGCGLWGLISYGYTWGLSCLFVDFFALIGVALLFGSSVAQVREMLADVA
jgi:hypothetical protein